MNMSVQYITNEAGERVGVLLDWNTYSRLSETSALDDNDDSRLVGLSYSELEALASCKLAVTEQQRLDRLIAKNTEAQLSLDEQTELDGLLAKADQLTLLKTRAKYTLESLTRDITTG